MPKYAVIYKEVGETPLSALERCRREQGIPSTVPMTYAGRLDPMASGLLLILIGDECVRKEMYTGLDKEYAFEVLFGAASDTGDVLGLAEAGSYASAVSVETLRGAAASLVGSHQLPYPAYSSKPLDGKPLFAHARAGTLDPSAIPTRSMRVYRIEARSCRESDNVALLSAIEMKMKLLREGDFRQDEILTRWRAVLARPGRYHIASFSAIVASGTYIRSLAHELGTFMGAQALAYSIERTKIGRYHPVIGGTGFWGRQYRLSRPPSGAGAI